MTYRISTGRGGAGNITESSSKAQPNFIKRGSQTPNILQPVYSTGRGGAGNMRKNIDAKLTRQAQDVDSIMPEEEDVSFGEVGTDTNGREKHNNDVEDGQDDYIEPISNTDLFESAGTPFTAVLSNIRSNHDHHNNNNTDSTPTRRESQRDIDIHERTKLRLKRTRSGKKEKLPAIVIGRGGAGNIVSPQPSSRSNKSNKSNKSDKSNDSNLSNTIPKRDNIPKKKKNFFSSLVNIFA